jgi:eukaryotic-like serine/threonine-protein kinase
MIGKTILHYKILEKLGEGGMGVVYRAHDSKLNRTVALKFLPYHIAANKIERARFLQEAQAAAILNHPNICIIYGIHDADDRQFIEMEYIDGVTLRKRIEEAPVKITDALAYAFQIGEALLEAHAKTIVHRDIKADNVMLTLKNQIKVMDFGLAKLKGSLKLTRTSSTVGTLGYMAPEQIQGGEVDVRSDIFSFGVLLYELLTGRFPFRGEHEAALVYSIVNEAPEPLAKHLPGVSSEIVHIIDKSLEKDPADRYQSVAEMVVDLRRVQKQTSRVSPRVLSSDQSPTIVERMPTDSKTNVKPKKIRFRTVGIASIIFLVVLAIIFLRKRADDGASAIINPEFTSRVLAIPSLQAFYPGLSTDGNWVAFPAADANDRWDIYYMHTARGDAHRITNDSAAFVSDVNADISPDGSEVAYNRWNTTSGLSEVLVVSSLGGDKKLVTSDGILARWRPDGRRIGFVRLEKSPRTTVSLWSAKPDGSGLRLEYADSLTSRGRVSYSWSPDAQSIAWIRSYDGGAYQEVLTHDLATGKERQLTFDKKNIDDVCWTRRGMIIFSSNKTGNTNLWMVPVEGGVARQITRGSGPDIGIASSSDNQKLVYLQQQSTGNVWIADFNRASATQLTFEDRGISSVAISPDGKRIAFTMGDIDPLKPDIELYVENTDGSERKQVTSGDVVVDNPSWSLDGKLLAFTMRPMSQAADSDRIYTVDAAALDVPKQVFRGTVVRWLGPEELIAVEPNALHNDLISLTGKPARIMYEDSTRAVPDATGDLIVFQDFHKGKEGFWTIPSDYVRNPGARKPKRIFVQNQSAAFAALTGNYLYWIDRHAQLWRMNVRTEAREQLKGTFPGLMPGFLIYPRQDNSGMAYIVRKQTGKLVMIENLFR